MVAQAVPAVAVEILLQGRAQLLLRLIIRGEIVIEKGQQILLRRLGAGQRRQVARTDVASKGGGKAQVGNDFTQQRQVLTVDLILQGDVGGADHQRFLFLAGDGDARDQI